MEREIIKNIMLLTLGKHLRKESVTDDERRTYNELIRAEQALSPIHITCSKHGNDILIYEPDEDIGPNFRRVGAGAICVHCPRDRSTMEDNVRLKTYVQI